MVCPCWAQHHHHSQSPPAICCAGKDWSEPSCPQTCECAACEEAVMLNVANSAPGIQGEPHQGPEPYAPGEVRWKPSGSKGRDA